jgi:hypothetical protein
VSTGATNVCVCVWGRPPSDRDGGGAARAPLTTATTTMVQERLPQAPPSAPVAPPAAPATADANDSSNSDADGDDEEGQWEDELTAGETRAALASYRQSLRPYVRVWGLVASLVSEHTLRHTQGVPVVMPAQATDGDDARVVALEARRRILQTVLLAGCVMRGPTTARAPR